jgi:gluconokinase
MWWKENEREIFEQAHKFISIKEYLLLKLTGKYIVDHSIASSSGMFNIRTMQWYEPALDIAGITKERLSEPVSIFNSYTSMPGKVVKRFGLKQQVPIVVGSSDGCLANIGSGVTIDGGIALTISTSMAVRITCPAPYYDDANSLFNYAIEPGKYACGGGSNSGSLLLKWMAESLLESKELQDPEKFMQKALTAPAGCDGLMFLPYLLGERAPVWDADATGVLVGLRFHHQQQHVMRALVEGLTMNAFIIIERLLPVAGNYKIIKASGGFTNSAEWVQMLADVSNLEVTVDTTADASAMGALMVAGFSTGNFHSLDTPLQSKQEILTCSPREKEHNIYNKNYQAFKKLYNKTHPLY